MNREENQEVPEKSQARNGSGLSWDHGSADGVEENSLYSGEESAEFDDWFFAGGKGSSEAGREKENHRFMPRRNHKGARKRTP